MFRFRKRHALMACRLGLVLFLGGVGQLSADSLPEGPLGSRPTTPLGMGDGTFAADDEQADSFPSAAGSAPAMADSVKVVTAEQVIEMLLGPKPVLLVDVKLAEEFERGHIEGAINIPDTQLIREDLEVRAESPDSLIIFYGNGSGCTRSANASRKAVEWGYTNVHWFRGGWKEWMEKRLPVAR